MPQERAYFISSRKPSCATFATQSSFHPSILPDACYAKAPSPLSDAIGCVFLSGGLKEVNVRMPRGYPHPLHDQQALSSEEQHQQQGEQG